jgi:ABC-2 type transport system ATP-binding protein
MIYCRHVTKRFADAPAVDDIALDISAGICALLGPNGAGKSTLLKILAGLLKPDHGEVRVAGRDIAREPLAVKREIGVLPEDLGLFDALTIAEHLELCGPIYGLTRPETRARMDDLLRVLDLDPARHTFLDQCSHGMRKKTALAMALLHSPRVLLLDEPFEGIDPVSSRAIRDLLLGIADRGMTVFLASHDLSMIGQLATHIMMMRAGRIVWNSAAGELPRPLEDLYFDLAENLHQEDLAWLRWPPS